MKKTMKAQAAKVGTETKTAGFGLKTTKSTPNGDSRTTKTLAQFSTQTAKCAPSVKAFLYAATSISEEDATSHAASIIKTSTGVHQPTHK